jgi:hypothetical protein
MDIYYRIGYAVFLLPCQIILTKVKPNWWLPSMEMAWGVMTGEYQGPVSLFGTTSISALMLIAKPHSALMAAAKSVKMMYALRFLIGVFEASSYPGIVSVLCNW